MSMPAVPELCRSETCVFCKLVNSCSGWIRWLTFAIRVPSRVGILIGRFPLAAGGHEVLSAVLDDKRRFPESRPTARTLYVEMYRSNMLDHPREKVLQQDLQLRQRKSPRRNLVWNQDSTELVGNLVQKFREKIGRLSPRPFYAFVKSCCR